MKFAHLVTLVVIAVLVITGFGLYGYVNQLRTESVQLETQLNAQYLSNQNYLSAFISGFYEQIGVADRKSEKLNEILTEAVKGRYDKGGFSSQGAFFSAVVEAYPQLGNVQHYDKIMDYVASQREGYKAIQDKLLDILRRYDAWRQDGIVQSYIVANILGIPSGRLEARLGDQVTQGSDARNQMYRIVLASEARDAYGSGLMAPMRTIPDSRK